MNPHVNPEASMTSGNIQILYILLCGLKNLPQLNFFGLGATKHVDVIQTNDDMFSVLHFTAHMNSGLMAEPVLPSAHIPHWYSE